MTQVWPSPFCTTRIASLGIQAGWKWCQMHVSKNSNKCQTCSKPLLSISFGYDTPNLMRPFYRLRQRIFMASKGTMMRYASLHSPPVGCGDANLPRLDLRNSFSLHWLQSCPLPLPWINIYKYTIINILICWILLDIIYWIRLEYLNTGSYWYILLSSFTKLFSIEGANQSHLLQKGTDAKH